MKIRKNSLRSRVAAITVLPAALLGVSACGNAEDDTPVVIEEQEADVGAPEEELEVDTADSFESYVGVYDREFFDDLEFYVGEEITVAAIVGEVISPNVFTIVNSVGPSEQDTVDVDAVNMKPLIIVHEEELPALAPGMPVGVTGVMHEEFYPATVEQDLNVSLGDDETFEEWEELAYIEANQAGALAIDGEDTSD